MAQFTAEQKKREDGAPVGILNVGNTCYFNSLLQVYFHIPGFVEKVLKFKVPEPDEEGKFKCVSELQMAFAKMIRGNQKFVNPSGVLENLKNAYGDSIRFAAGEQNDVHEFHMQFIESLNNMLNA